MAEALQSRIVSKSRSETWARMFWMYIGGSKPKRSSMRWVSSLIEPMRTARYSRSPRALRRLA